eukprot:1190558-Prorocentrum_minimum.AAC.4
MAPDGPIVTHRKQCVHIALTLESLFCVPLFETQEKIDVSAPPKSRFRRAMSRFLTPIFLEVQPTAAARRSSISPRASDLMFCNGPLRTANRFLPA